MCAPSGTQVRGHVFIRHLRATENGDVYCWGRNEYGELGLGQKKVARVPRQVPGLKKVNQVSVGAHHALALVKSSLCGAHALGLDSCSWTLCYRSGSNEFYVWGRGTEGQLGLGFETTHVRSCGARRAGRGLTGVLYCRRHLCDTRTCTTPPFSLWLLGATIAVSLPTQRTRCGLSSCHRPRKPSASCLSGETKRTTSLGCRLITTTLISPWRPRTSSVIVLSQHRKPKWR